MNEMREISKRSINLGGISVDRYLPKAEVRTIGPWCFVDRMSNLANVSLAAMEVAPHPHFGLSTVTFLLEGMVLHTDSLKNRIEIKPGQVNIMTAGGGISHSEVSVSGKNLFGLQLWAALPQERYLGTPSFEHFPSAPVIAERQFDAQVISGAFLSEELDLGLSNSALGVVFTAKETSFEIPLAPNFEHILIPLYGKYSINGISSPNAICVKGLSGAGYVGDVGSRFLMLAGEPFSEKILMWWNFVGRSWSEIHEARRQWNEDDGRFGRVDSELERLLAPSVISKVTGH